MKKLGCLFLASLFLMTMLVGCGEQETATTITTTAATTTTTVSSADETTTTTTTATTTTTTAATTTIATTTVATTTAATTALPLAKDYILSLTVTDQFNEDGSLNLDMLAFEGMYLVGYDEYQTKVEDDYMTAYYAVPETDVLTALRRVYVISDAYFNQLKAKGTYQTFGPNELKYENGQFLYTRYDGWGGGNFPVFKPLSYTDDNNGTLKFYFDYGIYEMGNDETKHQRYLEVTYTYTDHAAFEVENGQESMTNGLIISKSENFIKSLRVKSIKPVATPAGNVTID